VELKDIILSTLEELDNQEDEEVSKKSITSEYGSKIENSESPIKLKKRTFPANKIIEDNKEELDEQKQPKSSMFEVPSLNPFFEKQQSFEKKTSTTQQKPYKKEEPQNIVLEEEEESTTPRNIVDKRFLENLRERILVLFEGFQSPNNVEVEAKVDLTLNFLEFLLTSVDEQLDKFNKEDNLK